MGEPNHVFGLAGPLGCGKTTAAVRIEETIESITESSAVTTEMADFVRARYEETNTGTVDDNALGAWAAEQKAEYGDGYFARELAETWDDPERPSLVVSGLRSPAEASELRDVFGVSNVTIVALWTLPDLRFYRKYGKAPRIGDTDCETFHERNVRELVDWGCQDFYTGYLSDYIIPNNDGVGTLKTRVRNVVSQECGHGHVLAEKFEPPLPIAEDLSGDDLRSFL